MGETQNRAELLEKLYEVCEEFHLTFDTDIRIFRKSLSDKKDSFFSGWCTRLFNLIKEIRNAKSE